jgi:predicted lipoprotein with Yx(FWY)xxD motif
MTLAMLVAAVLGAGCGSNAARSDSSAGSKHVTVDSRQVAGLGRVLVNSNGDVLYMFPPDHRRKVACTGACAGTWPPLRLSAGAKPVAGTGIKAQLLGSLPNPGGGRVVTYHGWPLYTYVGDLVPSQANGQALNLNGGFWYVLRPDGRPLIPTGRTSNNSVQ